ncbi:MAG: ATPase, partial [Sphingobacteriales bacterium]
MQAIKPSFSELFDHTIEFPDPDMHDRYQALVGLEEIQDRLKKMLGILINNKGISSWAKKNHPDAAKILDLVQRRPPLIILAGDVGSGKSELAYTIGNAIAKQEKIDVTL